MMPMRFARLGTTFLRSPTRSATARIVSTEPVRANRHRPNSFTASPQGGYDQVFDEFFARQEIGRREGVVERVVVAEVD